MKTLEVINSVPASKLLSDPEPTPTNDKNNRIDPKDNSEANWIAKDPVRVNNRVVSIHLVKGTYPGIVRDRRRREVVYLKVKTN